MIKAIKKGTSALLLLSIVFMLLGVFFGIPVSASGISVSDRSGAPALKPISSTAVWRYAAVPISYNGVSISQSARMIGGIYYIPLRAFTASVAPDMKINYNSKSRTMSISGGGLSLTASDGSYTVMANDRAFFALSPARILSDGRMYIPAATVESAFGVRAVRTGNSLSFSGKVTPATHASRFYDNDELYWLSRIISAESRGEPLIGQIAVGNVVLNRVRSSAFPNTIYGVIFDRKYGVQFSPVANGTVYAAPTYTATLAAKICLEGYSHSDEILYFLAPRYASSSWIAKNRQYAFTIGNHDFYN